VIFFDLVFNKKLNTEKDDPTRLLDATKNLKGLISQSF